MKWDKATSYVKPPEYDFDSSKVYNYIRKNIKEHVDTNEETNETLTLYTYEEAKVPKESWDLYKDLEKAQADIDYLTMITEDM